MGREPAKGGEGQGAREGQDGDCYWGQTPPSCCATPPARRGPKKLPGCYFSGPQWGNWGSKKSFRVSQKRAEGAKKIISGGEKNKVVGRPHAGGQKNNLRQDWGRKNNHGGRKN